MEFRNSSKAFDGEFIMKECPDHILHVVREHDGCVAELIADLAAKTFEVRENGSLVEL